MPRLSKSSSEKGIRQGLSLVILAVLLLSAPPLWSRLISPPSTADVRALAEQAPHVFRGQVVTVTPFVAPADRQTSGPSVATIRVDRWYRGEETPIVSLSFTIPNPSFGNGHNCIDFHPDDYWLVFAVKKGERFEMIDDCIGALAISAHIAPFLKNTDPLEQTEPDLAQMEADFMAGLADNHPEARLLSIQRLGGLKLPSSQDALHRVIADGKELESKWAVYAALRTGDITVLPAVRRLLTEGEKSAPENEIALELRHIDDRLAAPELVAILKAAPGEMTRDCALVALSENLKIPKTVPTIASFLSDDSHYVRYDAMLGLRNITHEVACTLPPGWTEPDVDPQLDRCRTWWQQVGRHQTWQ